MPTFAAIPGGWPQGQSKAKAAADRQRAAAVKRAAKPLERRAEDATVRWARARGILVSKLSMPGQRGWPDRAFWLGGGHVVMLEFKRPGGGKLSSLQKIAGIRLRSLGYAVSVVESTDEAIKLLSVHIVQYGGA